MKRVVRLRLRTTRILRDKAIHQIENNLFCDEWIGINFRKAFRAKARALCEATPVVDVGNCHVVNTTSDSIGFADTHHRNIDDLIHFGGNDVRNMTHIARVLGVGKNWHFARVAEEIEIAPNEFSQ